jgi:iron transport multicopper oxidase
MRTFAKLGAFSALSSVYAAIGPVSNVYIGNKNIQPDGFTRSAVLVGSSASTLQFPGPLITANKGDAFRLNVIDELTDTTMLRTTSVHWHGFFQKGTNWADGGAGVSQCPITPGSSFEYRFNDPEQAGTFWYHSHHSSQYCDGLRGVMVVYDPKDPHLSKYDVDNESTVITLGDWYHTVAHKAGAFPDADSTLINGKGRYAGGPTVPLSVINVQPNKRYRFRLVSISCDPNYIFSIDGHTMTVIEADGVNTQPYTVDSIQIFAGQRYSFVVTANRPVGNYWIRANPNIGTRGFAGGINSAILRYQGAPAIDPNTTSTASNLLNEAKLVPFTSPALPGTPRADVKLHMDIAFAGEKFTVNGAEFIPPPLPVLLQIMSGASTPADILPAGVVYELPINRLVEISFTGGGAGEPHPMHLHGHVFDVVRSAGSSVYNYDNPIKRDTVSVGTASDNVTIRFRTDNAGPWFLHCHIDWHLEAGLAVVFAEDIPSIAKMNPPDAWDELCPKYEDFGPEFPDES